MPVDRPYLPLPFIGVVECHGRSSGGREETLARPEIGRQIVRLRGQISRLEQVMTSRSARLQSDPAGAEPSEVLVLECAGTVAKFVNAVRKTPELEWLGEFTRDAAADSEFFDTRGPERAVPESVYLVMQDARGMSEFLRLWRLWESNPQAKFPHKLGKWKSVFCTLRKVRYWGPEDRVTPGLLDDWREKVAAQAAKSVVEIECWYSSSDERRSTAIERLSGHIVAVGGRVLDKCDHKGIRYLGLLAELPTAEVARIIQDPASQLVRADSVMYFLRQGQTLLGSLRGDAAAQSQVFTGAPTITEPLIALIDGLPQENHPALAGCLRVSDPNNLSAEYPVESRVHGTSMAGLICRGDLRAGGIPLQTPLFAVPVMVPVPQTGDEELPQNRLIVKLMIEAVEHIVREAPTVRIINCSLGEKHRPFDRAPSPWARILDYLAHRHDLLFVVSAGNASGSLPVAVDRAALETFGPRHERLRTATVLSMGRLWASRRLLSPAEGINVLTVGAAHSDSHAGNPLQHEYDCLGHSKLPATYSRQGPGANRSTKPEIYVQGGRVWHRLDFPVAGSASSNMATTDRSTPGLLVAAPGPITSGSALIKERRGTSIAAALTSRSLGQLHESIAGGLLDSLQVSQRHTPVLLKALKVHRASWGEAANIIRDPSHDLKKHRRVCSRMLGFGHVELGPVPDGGTRTRVSLVAVGSLRPDKAARYKFPLPTELRGVISARKVITTLAWSSPIVPDSTDYRGVAMECRLHGNQTETWTGRRVQRRADPADGLGLALNVELQEKQLVPAEGGTIEHLIWEGAQVMDFDPEGTFHLQVDCRQKAGSREIRAAEYPFALAVTLSISSDIGIDLYARVQAAIRVPLAG